MRKAEMWRPVVPRALCDSGPGVSDLLRRLARARGQRIRAREPAQAWALFEGIGAGTFWLELTSQPKPRTSPGRRPNVAGNC